MILQKLSEARAFIKGMELKKAGLNKFSNYDYFTPEQINKMVYEAEKETGLIHIFNMDKNELGVFGHLLIYEIETGECQAFTQLTAIPEIKATNITQQIGGAVTYTNRYMLMTAFDISDNSLDFDADREPETKPAQKGVKTKINEKQFIALVDRIKAVKEPLEMGNLLAKARQNFTFTDEQEMIIADLTDNSI
jgi:hypothetical protein